MWPSNAKRHRLARARCRLQICDTAEYNSALRLRPRFAAAKFGGLASMSLLQGFSSRLRGPPDDDHAQHIDQREDGADLLETSAEERHESAGGNHSDRC